MSNSDQNSKTCHLVTKITATSKDYDYASADKWNGAKTTSAFVEPEILNIEGNFRDYFHNRSIGVITGHLQNLNPFSRASNLSVSKYGFLVLLGSVHSNYLLRLAVLSLE